MNRGLAPMRRIALAVFIFAVALPTMATAQQGFPGCVAWLGPGSVPHPDYPLTCCHPGLLPVPGRAMCVKPDDPRLAGEAPENTDGPAKRPRTVRPRLQVGGG